MAGLVFFVTKSTKLVIRPTRVITAENASLALLTNMEMINYSAIARKLLHLMGPTSKYKMKKHGLIETIVYFAEA
jgi:hypothetical protein